mgnify:CR=1 FL=1
MTFFITPSPEVLQNLVKFIIIMTKNGRSVPKRKHGTACLYSFPSQPKKKKLN